MKTNLPPGMDPRTERLLFSATSSLTEKEDRRAFLEFVCRDDQALLREMEELIAADGTAADDLFEFPAEIPPAVVSPQDEENRIGPYRLIDRLGAGGYGVVYLAEQEQPVRRKVAVKIIRVGLDSDAIIARFQLEKESLSLMDHPNIARVLDAGTTASGRPYFAMELVDGEKITDFCDKNRLSLRQRLELFLVVCDAIQHAHHKGVVHRDIKPANVLVTRQGSRGVPKVIDFGIVKTTHSGVDETPAAAEQFLGTPAYMSPEQAAGNPDIDTRSDLYGLGALLSELIIGTPPWEPSVFANGSQKEVSRLLAESDAPRASVKWSELTNIARQERASLLDMTAASLGDHLTRDLDWIIAKATARKRQDRYQTANELALDVGRYLHEEPILAKPFHRGYVFLKLVRRNRLIFTATSIAMFGLLAGSGVSTWLFIRERNANRQQMRLTWEAETARANEARLHATAKAVELITQAAILLKYNEFSQADDLLAKLPPELVPTSLETSSTIITLANWNLTQQHWQAAAQRFNLLVQVLAKVDSMDVYANAQEWLPAAVAICEWGEPGQYEEFCKLAVRKFSHSSNPDVAEFILRATLLKPTSPEILASLDHFESLLKQSLIEEKEGSLIASRRFTLAMLAYRRGLYDEARDYANLSEEDNAQRQRVIMSRALIVMSDLKQSIRSPRTRQTVANLKNHIVYWEQLDSPESLDRRFSWAYWSSAKLLRSELEALVSASPH